MDEGLATLAQDALRLGLAALLGGVLGLNRALHRKAAGSRTLALVAMGSALVTRLSLEAADPANTTRVLQGIITGIGFLGAGVILQPSSRRPGTVRGLTTAAAIWLVAGLGAACGAGRGGLAVVALGLTLLVLVLGKRAEAWFTRRFGENEPEGPGPD